MQTIIGMFDSRQDAERVIARIQATGIDRESISVAMRDQRESAELSAATESVDLGAEGATTGAVSGAGIGALVGLALVGSSILLPGIGTVLIGGPLAAALTGAGIGAASGGVIGGLIGSGIPEEEAQHFSTGLESGRVIVSVQSPERDANLIRKFFDDEGSLRTYLR